MNHDTLVRGIDPVPPPGWDIASTSADGIVYLTCDDLEENAPARIHELLLLLPL